MNSKLPLIFDGHNDVLLKLSLAGGNAAIKSFLDGRNGHIDQARARKGGFGGGFFAIFVRSPFDLDEKISEMSKPQYDLPLPDPIPASEALPTVMEQAALLIRLEEAGAVRICRSTADIRKSFAEGRIAAIMHIEGAEAIDPDFYALDVLYHAGLRSIGPVWSRPTIWGEGVPFRYPSTGDIGGGLTEHGIALVKICNARGIMVDLSHLNEAGFWDVAKHSDAPLVATHSNVHAISPHARNLTDKQLAAIAESDGMVGLNFAAAFLREDGQMKDDIPLETMLRHLDHLMAKLGEDRVGLGSDFDGAMVPKAISDAGGLTNLRDAMRAHGYGEDLMEKLCHKNWLRVLDKTWGTGEKA
ncbi:membrane dipeptidase [Pseudohalocynthiibacter aestuariivivens]|nr:dipeptidase [Pseudohalocynthiibacter aestuariivivens]QIE45674.1 membrane dipeptidase [Pseudohalocynthiibacter aestuariivivens]